MVRFSTETDLVGASNNPQEDHPIQHTSCSFSVFATAGFSVNGEVWIRMMTVRCRSTNRRRSTFRRDMYVWHCWSALLSEK